MVMVSESASAGNGCESKGCKCEEGAEVAGSGAAKITINAAHRTDATARVTSPDRSMKVEAALMMHQESINSP